MKKISKKTKSVLDAYATGMSVAECARAFDMHIQNVYQAVMRHCPQAYRGCQRAANTSISAYTPELSGATLEWLLSYDPQTGHFHHLTARGGRSGGVGAIAGTRMSTGYIGIKLPDRLVLAHRLAWLWMTGKWPDREIDHINGDRADNRWSNLREATRSQQAQNGAMRSTNTSGRIGVFLDKSRQKWVADVTLYGKSVFRNRYDSFQEACVARESAERKAFGEFASNGRRAA